MHNAHTNHFFFIFISFMAIELPEIEPVKKKKTWESVLPLIPQSGLRIAPLIG